MGIYRSKKGKMIDIFLKSEQVHENSDLQVFNLSKISLSPEHIAVLKKGLSFVPTQVENLFKWVKDIHFFSRKLALKKGI